LLRQLDETLGLAGQPGSVGSELGASAAIDPAPDSVLDPVRLAKGTGAYVDAGHEAAAVAFFPPGQAKILRRKLDEYGDPARTVAAGEPRNNALIAPMERIRRPTLVDLASPWDLEAELRSSGAPAWLELWVPGGRLGKEGLRSQIKEAVDAYAFGNSGTSPVRYEATDHDIFLVRLPPDAIRRLPTAIPAVMSIRRPSQARLERFAQDVVADAVADGRAQPAPPSAPVVAVLDTGVAEDHPLLEKILVAPGVSVVPGVISAGDGYPGGHGTGMAGGAAYADLAGAIVSGDPIRPRCRLANVRLWSAEDPSTFWASRTEEAVAEAEAMADIHAYVLCLSSGDRPPTKRTSWSFAIDRLAYNEGAGRLFCVAGGNVSPEADPAAYPAKNLASEIHDPAQAVNALTVGGYTSLDALRHDRSGLVAVAAAGELSPYTTTGTTESPIKPDVLMEAGNACPDGTIANSGIEELGVLTTSSRHALGRHVESDQGTSIGAAALAGLAADISAANPTRRPETIRALIVNSARWPAALRAQLQSRSDRLRCAGYGVPSREHALASTQGRATLVHEGRMAPYSSAHKMDALHLFRLPLPASDLLALGDAPVSLSVTLSYFVEPHETRVSTYAGAWLQWDLQRQAESEADFLARINARDRDLQSPPDSAGPWQWEVGPKARQRGSVQGDRMTVEAAALANDLLIGVFPAGGWWRDHLKVRAGREMAFAIVITIDGGEADVDLYSSIAARLPVGIAVDSA
jgi:hypothetical protein